MQKDINIDDYLALKDKRMTDEAIVAFFRTSKWHLAKFKQEHGLVGKRIPPKYSYKLEKKKKRYLELYNAGWSHEWIADEMNLSPSRLTEFKREYFPEHMRKSPRIYTPEEIKMMEDQGINRQAMTERLRKMSWEEAIQIPPKDPMFSFTKAQNKAIKKSGISRGTVRSRMLKGMSFHKAINTPPMRKNQHTKGAI